MMRLDPIHFSIIPYSFSLPTAVILQVEIANLTIVSGSMAISRVPNTIPRPVRYSHRVLTFTIKGIEGEVGVLLTTRRLYRSNGLYPYQQCLLSGVFK